MKIGLTGGIGSGKSTVAAFLAEAGATIIDTDAISRSLTIAGGAAMPAIAAEFGTVVVAEDGALDRQLMRELAFADASVKRRLEAILHPLIGAVTQKQAAAATTDLVVFDVPLLVESGRWRARVERVLVVDCAQATQIARVMQRAGWTQDAAQAVIAQQASREARRACADAVLHNDDIGLTTLRSQVLALGQRWQALK